MNRREVLFVLGALAAVRGFAQTGKPARIGWLSLTARSTTHADAFIQGLRDLGYVDGRNLTIEHRISENNMDRALALASELVQLKVDVLVALEPPAVSAARSATRIIPIVIRSTDDPVEAGLVTSLARPAGNITGVTSYSTALIGKRMELLKETIPKLSRIAVLWKSGESGELKLGEARSAAQKLGIRLQMLEVRGANDFAGAFAAAIRERARAIFTLRSPLIVNERRRIAELALDAMLPAIYDDRAFVEAGGLMSYGANVTELYRRAAAYVDKILRGAKPADLPVEQPTRFELVINLKTAKALGLTIPQTVLLRADEVFQ